MPLACREATLGQAYESMRAINAKPLSVPLIIRLVENPEFDLPGFDVFHGSTSLETHDYIHILLGRGVLPKDEAFVIGFTMGSTDLVTATEEKLFGMISKYLYPKVYKFNDDDLRVFRDAVRLGFVSDCRSLAGVDYRALLDKPLGEIRPALGIEEDLLRAYYAIEKRRFPDAPESRPLLDPSVPLRA